MPRTSRIVGPLVPTAVLAVVYAALAYWGIRLSQFDPVASPLWPAAGVALAALLWRGRGLWPGILIGETAAVWQLGAWSPASLGPALLSGAGNAAAGWLAAWCIERWLGKGDLFQRPSNVLRFALVATAAAAPVAATTGTLARLLGGAGLADAPRIWATWWLGDAASLLILTPLLLVWLQPWGPHDPDRRRLSFGFQAVGLVLLASFVVANGIRPVAAQGTVVATIAGYASITALVWAVILLRLRGATAMLLVLAVSSIAGILNGNTNGRDPGQALISSVASIALFQLACIPIAVLVEDRRSHLRTLEARVAERTRQLTAAKEAADQAALAKANFLAVMSHEIRTPLNAVIGTAELMRGEDIPAAHRENLDTILTSSEHLLTIINDILDYSRADAGKLVIEAVPVDLGRVAHEAMRLVEGRISPHAVRMTLEAEDLQPIVSDPHRIRQVLLNYLSNAAKFTPKGTITLRIRTTPTGPERVQVDLSVEDTGVGIAPEHQGDLFQPFTQVASAFTRTTGGTGLGLAIVKRILDTLGGTVRITSTPGAGSTFSARFEAPVARNAPKGPAQATRKASRALRILMVDDDAMNRLVASRMLERLGHKADLAPSAREGIAMARTTAYDAILMDVHMPEMDGLEATRIVRRDEIGHRARIIAMTADVLAEDRERCLAAGMDDYVAKPVRLEALAEALAQA